MIYIIISFKSEINKWQTSLRVEWTLRISSLENVFRFYRNTYIYNIFSFYTKKYYTYVVWLKIEFYLKQNFPSTFIPQINKN